MCVCVCVCAVPCMCTTAKNLWRAHVHKTHVRYTKHAAFFRAAGAAVPHALHACAVHAHLGLRFSALACEWLPPPRQKHANKSRDRRRRRRPPSLLPSLGGFMHAQNVPLLRGMPVQ